MKCGDKSSYANYAHGGSNTIDTLHFEFTKVIQDAKCCNTTFLKSGGRERWTRPWTITFTTILKIF